MSSNTERDWTTKSELRAVCLYVNDSNRCGYVEVPAGHPLHGVQYGEPTEAIAFDEEKIEVGKKGPILVLTAGLRAELGQNLRRSPDVAFDVHGGLTYSGGGNGYPANGDGWWFGFDCGHAGDATSYSPHGVFRTEEYVVSECESLAKQIVEMFTDSLEAQIEELHL